MTMRVSSPRFIGREAELDRLLSTFAQSQEGEPRVVLIGGEAGVGKSRLVEEFTGRARQSGAAILAGGCIELAQSGLAFAPITEALRGLVRALDRDECDALLDDRRQELSRLVPELGMPREAAWTEGLRSRLFDSVLSLLERLGDRAPVLIVIEDVHWADDSTRDLLAFVIHNLRAVPVMLCLTYRSDELHRRHPLKNWLTRQQRHAAVERLELHPLDRSEIGELATGILGSTPVQNLIDRLFDRADGNPLFTEELLAAHQANGDSDLSPTLAELLASRVDSLSEASQEVLRAAAVAGRSVDHSLLATVVTSGEDELLDGLSEAVEHHVLVVDSATSRYTFRHALVREVVYAGLLPGQRSRIHAAFARALAAEPGLLRTGPAAAELAHHWYSAHELPRALSASIEAGLAAEQAYAFPEALQHFERALDLWESVRAADDFSPLDRVSVQEHAANAAYQAADPSRAVALLQAATQDLVASGDRARAGLLLQQLGRVQRWGLGDDAGAIESQRQAVDLLAAEKPSAVSVRGLAELGGGLAVFGRLDEAKILAETALGQAKELRDATAEPLAHNAMGLALQLSGESKAALPHFEEFLQLVKKLDDPDNLGRAYVNLSDALARLGRFDEAIDVATEGLAAMQRLGFEHTHGKFLLCNIAEFCLESGRWDDVERATTKVLKRSERTTRDLAAAIWRFTVRVRRGDFEAALRDLETARDLSGLVSQPSLLGPLQGALAEMAIWQGRHDDASRIVDEGLEIIAHAEPWSEVHLCFLGLRAAADRAELARARREDAELAAILMRGRELQERSESLGAQSGVGTIPGYAAMCKAELTRLDANSDPEQWKVTARVWQAIGCAYPLAYANWRRAEAILARKSDRHGAKDALRTSHDLAAELGARPLQEEVEGLARRARIDMTASVEVARSEPSEEDRLGLTPRELDVLKLVATGRTNRQIATELFISPKTANVHVSSILAKLGVTGRVEAATLAHRLGLIENDLSPAVNHARRV